MLTAYRHKTGLGRAVKILGGIALWLLASYLFFRRFPNNYRQPNFYAEDGSIFAENIFSRGLLGALTTTFNGYYLWGIYLLEKAGMIINAVFGNSELVNLPRSLAVTSYLFLGFCASLPMLILRKYIRPLALALMTTALIWVPMLGSDYAVIGTIGNLKFAFVFIAFVLLVYRHFAPEQSSGILLADIGILICAYTNVTVYFMMPFAVLRYWPKLKARERIRLLKDDRSFRSLIILGIALLPQLYIIKRDGVPALPGYLDSPYRSSSSIEIFLGRSFLYGVLFPVYTSLTNLWSIILIGAAFVASLRYAKRYRQLILFGFFTVFITTFTFVIKRTGISEFYSGYKNGGFDQFFYAQNWIFIFVLSIVFVELVGKLRDLPGRLILYGTAFGLIFFALAPNAGSYGKNNFMEKGVGTIYAEAKADCASNQQNISLTVYPSKELQYAAVTRQEVCTPSAINYVPKDVYESLGLAPDGNNYVEGLGVSRSFSQTYKATDNNLNGFNVYFSTFESKPKAPYLLTLYTEDCKTKILTAKLPNKQIRDNSYALIRFDQQPNSKGRTYCFSIASVNKASDPLAVQLSAPNVYTDGEAVVDGKRLDLDIVFEAHYR